jgi:TonB family protein
MSFVVETVLRSSLVLAAGFAAVALLRKQPASLRHWALMATLALAAAQPAIHGFMPAWHIVASGWTQPQPEGTAAASTEIAFELPASAAMAEPASAFYWSAAAFQVWLAGVIVSVGILLIGTLWLTWLTARATNADSHWQIAADDVRRRLGIHRPIRVAVTQHPAMLVTWGVLAPVILLPRTATTWSPDRIQLVLAHEMAHLVRRDWLVQLSAELLRALNWFNPLFWIACARLRRESEYACDDIVLDLGTGGTAYAGHLVDLARTFSAHGRTWLPAPSIARPSTLERRVRAMLNPHIDRRPVSRTRRVALALLLLAIALPIAAASRQPGDASGVLRDPSGRVLPNATVRMTAVNGDATYEAVSDASGTFQFAGLTAGDYMLSARLPGFLSSRQRVRIASNMEPLSVTLQVGTLKERVTVNSSYPQDGPRTNSVVPPAETAPACGSTELGGNLKPPKKLRDVRPRYRQALIDANVEGEVLLQARIGVDGRIREIEVVSPVHAELEEEAIAAVSQWEFSPTYLNCEPIEVRMFVTVGFKIDR